jgi:hypothetical protein
VRIRTGSLRKVKEMNGDSSAASSASASGKTSRRRLLAWFGAGGAAVLATLFSRDEARAGHDGTNVLHLGEENKTPAGSATVLEADVDRHAFTVLHSHTDDSVAAIRGVNSSAVFGHGVLGESRAGSAVSGHGTEDAVGVAGESQNAAGVVGLGNNGQGVFGASFAHVGVHGEAENPEQPAVLGESWSAVQRGPRELGAGPGVLGRSGSGAGVRGESLTGIGIEAVAGEGLALKVVGRAVFSSAGSAVIPAGQETAFVPNPAVSGQSNIAVTLASDPGPRQVRWVERSPGSGFTVHLSSAPPSKRPETSLTYLIIEPA